MGIDALDLVFRMEKEYGVKLSRPDANSLFWGEIRDGSKARIDPTIGEIHNRWCQVLIAHGQPVPPNSWEMTRRAVSMCLRIPIDKVTESSRFISDLGAT